MFTGIVEELGEVVSLAWEGDGAKVTVRGPLVVSDAKHGDSITPAAARCRCGSVSYAAPVAVKSRALDRAPSPTVTMPPEPNTSPRTS